jgi:hypothetical protein
MIRIRRLRNANIPAIYPKIAIAEMQYLQWTRGTKNVEDRRKW